MQGFGQRGTRCVVGILGLALLAAAGGCTGSYDDQLENTLQRWKGRALFNDVKLDTPLRDMPLTIGFPKTYNSTPLTEGDAKRVKMTYMDLGDYLTTYEQALNDSAGGKRFYYLYSAVLPLPKEDRWRSAVPKPGDPNPRMDTSGWVYKSCQQAVPGLKANWEDVSFPTPTREQIAWQKLRVTGKDTFAYEFNNEVTFPALDGVLEIYARADGKYLTLVAWRVPADLEDVAKIAHLAPLMLGAYQVLDK